MSGTLVLGCEGLSKLVRRSLEVTEWLTTADDEDIRVVTSSVTLVEARDPEVDQARFDHAVSRVNIVPPTEATARHASKLLAAAGLHGHKYAIDAIVAATALASPAPVTVLTSDPEDLLARPGPGPPATCRAHPGQAPRWAPDRQKTLLRPPGPARPGAGRYFLGTSSGWRISSRKTFWFRGTKSSGESERAVCRCSVRNRSISSSVMGRACLLNLGRGG